jgi:hypothetical protein
MGLIQQLTDPDPGTFPGLLAWLATEAGWSAATAIIIAVVIWAWQKWQHVELGDFAKSVLAYSIPFVIIIDVFVIQAALGIAVWDWETLYERIYAAVLALVGSQFVYLKVWKPLIGQ